MKIPLSFPFCLLYGLSYGAFSFICGNPPLEAAHLAYVPCGMWLTAYMVQRITNPKTSANP